MRRVCVAVAICALAVAIGCSAMDEGEIEVIQLVLPEPTNTPAPLALEPEEIDIQKHRPIVLGGWTYELRPRENLPDAYPYTEKIACVVREKDGQTEVLDERAAAGGGLIEAGDKLVYKCYGTLETEDVMDPPSIASIDPDGKGKITYDTMRGVCDMLCYDGGFLYYGGYAEDGVFPRPLNRIRTDLKKDLNLAKIDGWFLTAVDGWGYFLHKDGDKLCRVSLDWSGVTEDYRDCDLKGCEVRAVTRTDTGFTVELSRGGEIIWYEVDV